MVYHPHKQPLPQVHPDLFSAHPYERAKNTEALQVGAAEAGLGSCMVEASDVLARHSMQAGCRMLQPTTESSPLTTCHPAAAQALNAYADQLSQGLRPQAAKLTFYVRGGEGEALTEVGGQPAHFIAPA